MQAMKNPKRNGNGLAALLLLTAAVALLGGCPSREHMRDDYGQKTRAFFAAQHVYADAARDQPTGLDSEESALIHGTYRKNLGGQAKGEKKDSSARVLIVEESKKNASE